MNKSEDHFKNFPHRNKKMRFLEVGRKLTAKMTLQNDKLYISQAKHYLKTGQVNSALNCINYALGKTT